nr:hypothetical protein [Tanacetum cinerariifolium]
MDVFTFSSPPFCRSKKCCRGVPCKACNLDKQNPKCLKGWENLDFQDLVVDGECFQVKVHCCGGLLMLMLLNNGWVDGSGSNSGGGFRNTGGGRETRGGGDGLEGLGGQLSIVEVQRELVLETHLKMMMSKVVCENCGEGVKKMVFEGDDYKVKVNSRKDGASLSLDDEDEEEMTEEEAILFPFSFLGFLEMSKGSMTYSWDMNLASGTIA